MASVILVIHLILALAIIGLVLLQRSEGGGLGIGGSGGLGGLATPQNTANILTRATAICAAGFFATSLILGSLAAHRDTGTSNIINSLAQPGQVAPAPAAPAKTVTPSSPEAPAVTPSKPADHAAKPPETPAKPSMPSAPVSE